MRSSPSLDRLDVAFDDDRRVADAGLLLPVTPNFQRAQALTRPIPRSIMAQKCLLRLLERSQNGA